MIVRIEWTMDNELHRVETNLPYTAMRLYEIMTIGGLPEQDIWYYRDGVPCTRDEAFEDGYAPPEYTEDV